MFIASIFRGGKAEGSCLHVMRRDSDTQKICSGKPLSSDELSVLLGKLGGGWRVVNDHRLQKDYSFKNFAEALNFTNCIGVLADEVGHHPDIYLSWGRVVVSIWTHSVDALTEADFSLAHKIEGIEF